ncbi:Zinc transporter 8 [Gracilariopsis chorda]|uniref:Zinc transporter 8 n=1 Tax=Gracilariopsis chorda TaxID=448386 RepID=A0A2V3IE30_9FLOR|nr:Zinc transporter 8 [Gracilariopsis chorda]|eukprot:PXF40349.1 Zinc transporter 8 [Gracilariopsis chorda]
MFGIVARSSALMVEALHTALDGLTVIISLVSALISRRKATKRMSYGYARAEVLSALLSVLALALLCAKLFATGVRRLWRIYNGEQIQVDGMLVALAEAITLVSNVGMALVLARGTSSKSLNLRALRAHVIADCIENVVVLVGGVIMWKIPNFAVLDPALTVVIVGVIVVMNIGICKETVATLMQSAPRGVVEGIADDLIAINGVMSVRRLHVWTLTTGCLIGTVVVIVDDDASHKDVKKQVEEVFAQFGVENVTVQINDADERDDGESIASDRSDTNVGANGYEFVREDDDIV